MSKNDKKSDFLKTGELAEESGHRYSTIKFYTEIGILPCKQNGERLGRKFDREKSLKRLKEIDYLRNEDRSTIKEIIDHFKRK